MTLLLFFPMENFSQETHQSTNITQQRLLLEPESHPKVQAEELFFEENDIFVDYLSYLQIASSELLS